MPDDAAPAFLCDGMLGHVARWLRLMGFDVEYAGSRRSDDEILERAGATGRRLVTRDRLLYQRATKRGLPSVLLSDGRLPHELAAILATTGAPYAEHRFFTRCTHCNAFLENAQAADVAHRVPARVLEGREKFSRCVHCGQVYWEGTHVAQIRRTLREVQEQLGQSP